MSKTESRITRITVCAAGDFIHSDEAIHVNVADEAVGQFIEIEQETNSVKINIEEWPAVRSAINRIARICRKETK